MAVLLGDLTRLCGGILRGDSTVAITGAATLYDVQAGEITFIDKAERLPQLLASPAAAAIVPQGVSVEGRPAIEVANVHEAFTAVVLHFRPQPKVERTGISPAAYVSPSAVLERDVDVHPGATIGERSIIGAGSTIGAGVHVGRDCRIGKNVTLHPGVVLYPGTVIGDHAVLHSGVIIGADGFGYETVGGRHRLCAQLGWVEIGAHVDVGANTTIDRGAYGPTRIGEGTKIDDQVMIAHNCQIGRHNLICSQVGIAGSTRTGDYVVIAGQAGIRDHVVIGDGALITAMAGITNDVPAGSQMMGIPATPVKDQRLKQAALSKLPEMRKQLKQLTQQIERLEAHVAGHDRDSKAAA